MKGIFVHETKKEPYATLITMREKLLETRNRNMLSSLVGERVAIISTRASKVPMIVGHATILWAEFFSKEYLDVIRSETRIPVGSKYDCRNNGKWCYYMADAEQCEPYPLPTSAIRHGRSWCEF